MKQKIKESTKDFDTLQTRTFYGSQLGHSSPTITLNVYAHLMKPTNQEAVCRLENTVLGEDGSKMVAQSKKGSRS